MSLAFVIDRKLLADELAIICRAIEGKTTIPVLTQVMIEGLENGTIKLTGTNLDIGMTSIIHPLKLATTGAITLPGRTLLNTLRKLPGTNVAFLEQEEFKTALICDQATVTLNGMSRESFPELPVCKTTAALAVYSTDLLRLISRTRYAICKEESRFTLNGALIESNGTTRMITTDGHRLVFAEVPIRARKDFKALIPAMALDLLPVFAGKARRIIALSMDEDYLFFTVDDRQLLARKLQGNFPDYERVLPKNHTETVLVPRLATRQVVERAKLFADERSHAIKLHLEAGKLTVTSSTVDHGDFVESLAVEYRGDHRDIGFDADYLTDFLSVDFGDLVAISAGKPEFQEDGVTVKSEGSWLLRPADPVADAMDYRYVLMPLRIN